MATARHKLKARRERQGLTQEALALEVGVATSTYREWESGTSVPRVGRRPRLAKALDVSLASLDEYFEEAPARNGQAVPEWLNLHAAVEQGASRVWSFQPFTVYALLQTSDYSAAVERADATPRSDEGVRRRVEKRMARQAVLARAPRPLELHVVLDESVLRRVTGDRAVMAGQLDHLAEMTEADNVTVQVLPLDAGRHSAGWGGFTLLASDGAVAQLVCVENRTGIHYLEGDHAVQAHVAVFDHLADHALTQAATVDLIKTLAKEYR